MASKTDELSCLEQLELFVLAKVSHEQARPQTIAGPRFSQAMVLRPNIKRKRLEESSMLESYDGARKSSCDTGDQEADAKSKIARKIPESSSSCAQTGGCWSRLALLLVILWQAHCFASLVQQTNAIRVSGNNLTDAQLARIERGQNWSPSAQLDEQEASPIGTSSREAISKRDWLFLFSVLNDTQVYGRTAGRLKAEQMFVDEEVKARKRNLLIFDLKRDSKREKESQIKSNLSLLVSGESKSNPQDRWSIYANDTIVLVIRSANKYYYWTSVQTTSAFLIFFMIVIGNASILHRLKSCRRRRSNVNFFFTQLAIADLLVGIFSVTLDSYLRIQKSFTWGLLACRASKYISVVFIYSSTNLLVALSFDRWEAVVRPLAFTRNRSRGLCLVLVSWLFACLAASPITYFTIIKDIDGLPQCWIELDQFGWKCYVVYLFITLLVIPTIIITICYISIVYTIWGKARTAERAGELARCHQHTPTTGAWAQLAFGFGAARKQQPAGELEPAASGQLQETLSQQQLKGPPLEGRTRFSADDGALVERVEEVSCTLHASLRESTGRRQLGLKKRGGTRSSRLRSLSQRLGAKLSFERPLVGPKETGSSSSLGHNRRRVAPARKQTSGCQKARVVVEIVHEPETPTGKRAIRTGQWEHLIGARQPGRQFKELPSGRGAPSEVIGGGQFLATKLESDGEQCGAIGCSEAIGCSGATGCPDAGGGQLAAKASRHSASGWSAGGQRDRGELAGRLTSGERGAPPETGGGNLSRQLAVSSELQPRLGLNSASITAGRHPKEGSRAEGGATTTTLAAASRDKFDNDEQEGAPARQTVDGSAGASAQVLQVERARSSDGPANETDVPGRGHQAPVLANKSSPERRRTVAGDVAELARLESSQGAHWGALAPPSVEQWACAGLQPGATSPGRGASGESPAGGQKSASGDTLAPPGAQVASGGSAAVRDQQVELGRGGASRVGSGCSGSRSMAVGVATHSRGAADQLASGPSSPLALGPPTPSRRPETDGARQHGIGVIPKARIKTIKMTLVIVVVYILCWTPFLVLNMLSVFGLFKNEDNVIHALMTLTQSLAHLNSAVNPIIFWLFSGRRQPSAKRPHQANQHLMQHNRHNQPNNNTAPNAAATSQAQQSHTMAKTAGKQEPNCCHLDSCSPTGLWSLICYCLGSLNCLPRRYDKQHDEETRTTRPTSVLETTRSTLNSSSILRHSRQATLPPRRRSTGSQQLTSAR